MPHTPRKKPRQARSQATQAIIIEAAARILEAPSEPSLTTNAIAEKAGISIGSLYQYFPDKRAILASLLRREWQIMLDAMSENIRRQTSAKAAIDAFIDIAIAHQFSRPRMSQRLELLEQSLDLDDDVLALSVEIQTRVLTVLQRYLPDASADMARDIVTICKAMINDSTRMDLTPGADLKHRLSAAVFGYLQAISPAR